VNVVILKSPEVEVEEVNPAPIVKVILDGYLIITMPDPPLPPAVEE
jgi:hypothetical protein